MELGITKEGLRSFTLGEELAVSEEGCDAEGEGDVPAAYSSITESRDMLDLLILNVAASLESAVC